MAAVYKCDGCGVEVTEPVKIGFVLKRDYCEKCAPLAEAFLAAQEAMHTNIREAFVQGREKMIEGAREHLKMLPDVP